MKKIVCDSAANLPTGNLNDVACVNVPLTLQIDGQAWVDDEQLKMADFLAALAATKNPTSSSCPNIQQWLDAFNGGDEIYVITITSVLSGSYNSAQQAATMYLEEHPEAKVHVFDSKSAGPTLALQAEKVAELVKLGLSFAEVVSQVEAYINQVELIFALGSLDTLAANGRVSSVVAKVTNLINIKVIGTAENGNLKMLSKVRGMKKYYGAVLAQMEARGYHGGEVLIQHTQGLDVAEKLKEFVLAKYPQAPVRVGDLRALCSFYAEKGGIMVGFVK